MFNLEQILTIIPEEYLLDLLLFVLIVISFKFLKQVIMVRLKRITDHTDIDFDDLLIKIVQSIGWPFYVLLALHITFQFAVLPSVVENFFFYGFWICFGYYIVKIVRILIDYGFEKLTDIRKKEDEGFDPSFLKFLKKISKIILWAIVIIIVLQNLGYNISALVTGLGIGGIAIAFALQNVLTDIFASFSIYFDKPFQVGDFIIVGEDMGVVKKIGIKSTRIQSLWGQEVIISNKELTEARVNNYKRMERKRVEFNFGVKYETPTDKLRKIPFIVKDIIDKIELAEMDRTHLEKFGEFSLVFTVVYYVDSPDYNKYMDIQQEINLAIREELEKEDIKMAYPTQKIIIGKIN